jgi:CRISPR/Cas system CMR subunit Cmr4 (Cas7 group RAMP superfamily)
MIAHTPHLTLWRLVLEADTPLSLVTGRGDGLNDSVLSTDFNGLPCIPGSSLAGCLRAGVVAQHGEALAQALFGHASGREGAASRVQVSHAHLLSSHSEVLCAPLSETQARDPLIQPLLERDSARRQRVRLSHRGAAADGGLFDRAVLPAGYRFAVEVALWASAAGDPGEAALQSLFARTLWLGGLTRAGLGAVRVEQARRGQFDLRQAASLKAYQALPHSLGATQGLQAWEVAKGQPAGPAVGGRKRLKLHLRPEGGFRFGDGARSLQEGRPANATPLHDLPKTETRVVWAGGQGQLKPDQILVPATSVKGPLAHRTAFHANRLGGVWATAERASGGVEYDKALHCEAVQALFGHAANTVEGESQGHAGLLRLRDAWIERAKVKPQSRQHNSIDRFTGGVRDGFLFSVENLHAASAPDKTSGDGLTLELEFDETRAQLNQLQPLHLQALYLALRDLTQGRLALGADSGGGLGAFQGSLEWPDGPPAHWPATEAEALRPAQTLQPTSKEAQA